MKKPIKLQRSHLSIGKPLPWNVFDVHGQLLLSRGYVIEKEPQLEALLARGMFIDAADLEASEKTTAVKNYDVFRFWDDISAKLGNQLAHPSREFGFSAQIADIGRRVQYLAQRSADAAIAIIMMTMDHRRYSIVHSLQVAVLCEMLANRLGWDPARRLELVCAALTMNVSMLEAQQQFANQSAPLTDDQRSYIRRHPTESVAVLRKAGVESLVWLAAVQDHHETASGTGYPRGVQGVSDEAAMLRTLDVYCAKISPRLHRKPMSGTQAARVLFAEDGMASNNPFIPSLIKEIGIYPPGSYVKLLNSETAIVHKRSGSINEPLVISLINAMGMPFAEAIRRDTSREMFKIKGDVAREQILITVNPQKIWAEETLRRYG